MESVFWWDERLGGVSGEVSEAGSAVHQPTFAGSSKAFHWTTNWNKQQIQQS